jgi:hypothetical protein
LYRAFSVAEEPSALQKSLQRCGRVFSVVAELQRCGRAFSVAEEPSALRQSLQRCGRAFSVVEEPSALYIAFSVVQSLQRCREPSVSKARDLGERLFINAPKS